MVDLVDTEDLLSASGLSLRRVQRAQERGALTPEIAGTQGRGRKTQWGIADLLAADVYRDLTDAGFSPASTVPLMDCIAALDGLKGAEGGILRLDPINFPAYLFLANGKAWAHDEMPTPERLTALRDGVFVVVDLHLYVARLGLYFDVRQVEPRDRMKRLCGHAERSPATWRAIHALVREAAEDGPARLLAFLGVHPKSDAALFVRADVMRIHHEAEMARARSTEGEVNG